MPDVQTLKWGESLDVPWKVHPNSRNSWFCTGTQQALAPKNQARTIFSPRGRVPLISTRPQAPACPWKCSAGGTLWKDLADEPPSSPAQPPPSQDISPEWVWITAPGVSPVKGILGQCSSPRVGESRAHGSLGSVPDAGKSISSFHLQMLWVEFWGFSAHLLSKGRFHSEALDTIWPRSPPAPFPRHTHTPTLTWW